MYITSLTKYREGTKEVGNTEDYLDSLLNSINSSNRSGKAQRSDDPLDNASEAFRKFEREQEYKREQRRRREEEHRRETEFLREFEDELEESDIETDDFLQQFELELEAEKGDDLESGQVDNTNFFENIEGIVSDAAKENEPQPLPIEPVINEMPEEIPIVPEEELVQEEDVLSVDSLFAENGQELEYATEEAMQEGDNGEEDLLELLSGMQDDELSEIGDLLKADEQNIELEEAALEMQMSSEADTDGAEEVETKASKKSKKDGKKKGFFAKLASALFGDDEEEEVKKEVEIPESGDLENISEENLQILKELEAAEKVDAPKEDDKKGKKKRKKKKDKDKDKEPKEKKERKKKVKKEKPPKPPKEPDNTPPLPKKPVVLIFLMAFSILLLVMLTINGIGNNSYIDAAKQAMDNGEYVEAYTQLSGLELEGRDADLYEKAQAMALVQEQYQAYVTMMGSNKYSLALDALVRGIGRYDSQIDIARKYGLEKELDRIKAQLTDALSNQFGMTEQEAKELYGIKDRDDYSIKIEKKIEAMNLRQVEE